MADVAEAACDVAQCQARRNDEERAQRLCLCAAACHRRDPGRGRICAGRGGDAMIMCRPVLTTLIVALAVAILPHPVPAAEPSSIDAAMISRIEAMIPKVEAYST